MKDVSFDLKKGEVLGFAGLMGAGRTETARAVFGADRIQSGSVEINGKFVLSQIHRRDRQWIDTFQKTVKGTALH